MNDIRVDTPVGRLRVSAGGGAIVGVAWCSATTADGGRDPLLDEAARQIAAYFAGRLQSFSLPLAPQGTPFRKRVWEALGAIPYRETRTYGEVAAGLGSVARAVGGACGANPIPLLIPCHRVTAAGGKPGGWSGGPGAKHALLALEAGAPLIPIPGAPIPNEEGP